MMNDDEFLQARRMHELEVSTIVPMYTVINHKNGIVHILNYVICFDILTLVQKKNCNSTVYLRIYLRTLVIL
jgi:hypothetical protein